MEKEVTVMRSGNSAVVALPAEWRRERGIEVGDKLLASFSGNGGLFLNKADGRKAGPAAFERIVKRAEAMPRIPWEDETREADRELAGKKYV